MRGYGNHQNNAQEVAPSYLQQSDAIGHSPVDRAWKTDRNPDSQRASLRGAFVSHLVLARLVSANVPVFPPHSKDTCKHEGYVYHNLTTYLYRFSLRAGKILPRELVSACGSSGLLGGDHREDVAVCVSEDLSICFRGDVTADRGEVGNEIILSGIVYT